MQTSVQPMDGGATLEHLILAKSQPGFLHSIFYLPSIFTVNPLNLVVTVEAVSREKFDAKGYTTCPISTQRTYLDIIGGDGPAQKIPVDHSGLSIAQSIINDFVRDTYKANKAAGMPGIMASANPKLSVSEREKLFEQQVEFARSWVMAGDTAFSSNRPQDISLNMIAAAEWLGITPDWIRKFADSTKLMESAKNCPYCGDRLKSDVVKCPNCKEIVDAQRYAELKAREEVIINKALDKAMPRVPAKSGNTGAEQT